MTVLVKKFPDESKSYNKNVPFAEQTHDPKPEFNLAEIKSVSAHGNLFLRHFQIYDDETGMF